ncbi:MAG TPA: hypothetical protein ENJ08_05810 [Gammaproteobacteria bacterium]|nr:hypothetical protein [Gammaproteobacteria bacterium]
MSIALTKYRAILRQLKKILSLSNDSMRSLCAKTQNFDIHERIYHSNLSELFSHSGRYNLSLQQFIMILKLLDTTPERFFAGSDRAALIAEGFNKLDEEEQNAIAKSMALLLEDKKGAKTIARQLSSR